MAELTAADVSSYTGGRLPDNAETQRLLDAALSAARRSCGWHVSPVRTGDVLELDGPGRTLLSLPTLKIVAVTAVTDDGITFSPSDVYVSKLRGLLRKRSGACWSAHFGGVSVTLTHGFAEAEAADWRQAILEMVDSYAQVKARQDLTLKRERVDDVEYEWFQSAADTSAKLDRFRILWP